MFSVVELDILVGLVTNWVIPSSDMHFRKTESTSFDLVAKLVFQSISGILKSPKINVV